MQNPNRMMTLILHRPDVDFATQRLVAIVFHDPNRFIELDIENVGLVSGTMQVICHFQPAPVQMNIISFGCYCAVVVGRVDGDAVFTSTPI